MSYNSEDYFLSSEFKSVLKRFAEAEANGTYAMLDSDELVDVAEYYYNNGNVKYALDIIETALSVYPGSAAPLLFKARIALIEHHDSQTAEMYTEQITDKLDVDYHYMKAEIMLADGHADMADEYLEAKFDEIDEDEQDYFAIDVAALFIDYSDIARGGKWLERSNDTNSADYKEQKARIMLEKGNYEKSEELYNELIDENPYSTQYWNSIASSQFFNNKIEESIRSSEYSIAINPNNVSALLNKANGLYNLGNYEEALKFYLRYNKLCPNDEYGEMLIGFCYLLFDKYEEAIRHFEKSEALSDHKSPNLVDIYKDWAFALCRLGRMDECMAVLDKASLLDCDQNEMLVYKGSLLLGTGHHEEAKEYFIRAIKSSGYSPKVFMNIATIVYESGDIEVSYNMFKTLFSANAGWTNGYAYFAACCYDLDKQHEFLDSLEKAVRYSPKEAERLLGKLFPEGMKPKDYYNYMLYKLGDK